MLTMLWLFLIDYTFYIRCKFYKWVLWESGSQVSLGSCSKPLFGCSQISNPGLHSDLVHLEKCFWYVRVGLMNPMFRLLMF